MILPDDFERFAVNSVDCGIEGRNDDVIDAVPRDVNHNWWRHETFEIVVQNLSGLKIPVNYYLLLSLVMNECVFPCLGQGDTQKMYF